MINIIFYETYYKHVYYVKHIISIFIIFVDINIFYITFLKLQFKETT